MLLLWIPCESFGQVRPKADEVVARLGSSVIYYSDVEIPDAEMALYQSLIKDAGTTSPTNEVAIRQHRENERLLSLLRNAVVAREAERMGLTVLAQEIAVEKEKRNESVDYSAVAEQHRSRSRAVLNALRALDQGQTPEEAYSEYLSSVLTPSKWKIAQFRYLKDLEQRKVLAASLELQPEDWSESTAGLDGIIKKRKLDTGVDLELAASDATFAQYLEKEASRNEQERSYLDWRRNEWWAEAYTRAAVEVRHDWFGSVSERLGLGRTE